MKKSQKRWLAAVLSAVMLTSGLMAYATSGETDPGESSPEMVNLAARTGVVATASNEETNTAYTADKARDGNTTDEASRWATDNDGNGRTPRWLQYDLGARHSISSFKVYWKKKNATNYTIQVSDNGTQWKDVVTKTEAPATETIEYTLEAPVEAQYVRLHVSSYGPAVNSLYNISAYEFEVYGDPTPLAGVGNLARLPGVRATASDTETENFPPSATIDGDTRENSRWGTNNAGNGTTERWLKVDLGTERTIHGVKVFWEKTNIRDYVIETSMTGENGDWHTAVTVEGAKQVLEPEHQLDTPTQARYIRLRVTRYDEAVSGWWNVGVREFEVYGLLPEESDEVVTVQPGTNLARLGGVTAEATNVESGTNFHADKAKDGNKTDKNSRWATDRNVSTPTITYQLGQKYMVGSVILYWENNNPISWKVETSLDGTRWETQASFSQKLNQQIAPIQTINFEQGPVEARQVRVRIEDYKGNWNNVAMYEFEVYQEPSDIVVTPGTVANALVTNLVVRDGKLVTETHVEVPENYVVDWGCNYEQVVGKDGTIYTPLVDTNVEITATVWDKAAPTNRISAKTNVTIEGTHDRSEGINPKPAVIPEIMEWYSSVEQNGKHFTLTDTSRIVIGHAGFNHIATQVKQDILDLFGMELEIVPATAKAEVKAGDIVLAYLDEGGFDKETYKMEVTDNVVIGANDPTGSYWGTRTALQALKMSGNHTIAQGTARDYPEFKLRGFMLDVGRKPLSMEMLKTIAKNMSWYKLNDFHVHLSDNLIFMEDYGNNTKEAWNAYQGHRLESTTMPGLESKDYHYTKEEFKNFIQQSRAIGINITPEIDVPAHALALTHYIKKVMNRPDLVLDKTGTFAGTTRPWFDHVDISKPEAIQIVKDLYKEYINDVFDEDTVVHIGADEFYDSHPAYRNFLKEMITFIEEDMGRQVRVWGSLTTMSGGEGAPFGPEDVKGAQLNIWNTGWANPQQMFNLGFDIINTVDRYLYMVPSGSGSRGNYGDMLPIQQTYNEFEPENVNGTWLPSGSSQMLGASFALWQDNIDTRAAGITETDTFYRFMDALPYVSVKMWGTGSEKDRDFNQVQTDSQKVGVAPSTNPYHVIDMKDGTKAYAQYSFSDTQDRSGNNRHLTLGGNAQVEDGALVLSGDKAFATTGLDAMGPHGTLTMKVWKDSKSNSGEQVLLETDAAYGDHMITATATENGEKWKLGFSRELYDYTFDREFPCDEWVELTIQSRGNRTVLLVNGQTVQAIGSFLPDEHATTQFKGKTGIEYSSFDIPVARIGSADSDVRTGPKSFQGKVDSLVFHANDQTPDERVLVRFDTVGGPAVEDMAVVKGHTVTKPADPVWEGRNFLGWYTDQDGTQIFDFATALQEDMTLFAKWEVIREPVDTTALEQAIAEAEKIDLNGYTPESVALFQEALQAAHKTLENPQDQESVDIALKGLEEAMAGLVSVPQPPVNPSEPPVEPTEPGNPSEKPQVTDKPQASEQPEQGGSVQTGDASYVMLYVAALALSISMLCGAAVIYKRQK